MSGFIDSFLLTLVIVVPLVISFACGYTVRDWISRRRRAAEREKFYKLRPEARRWLRLLVGPLS